MKDNFCPLDVSLDHAELCVILPLSLYRLRPYNTYFNSNLLFPSYKDSIIKILQPLSGSLSFLLSGINSYVNHILPRSTWPPHHGYYKFYTLYQANITGYSCHLSQISYTIYCVCYRIPYECINHVSIIYYSLWMDLR